MDLGHTINALIRNVMHNNMYLIKKMCPCQPGMKWDTAIRDIPSHPDPIMNLCKTKLFSVILLFILSNRCDKDVHKRIADSVRVCTSEYELDTEKIVTEKLLRELLVILIHTTNILNNKHTKESNDISKIVNVFKCCKKIDFSLLAKSMDMLEVGHGMGHPNWGPNHHHHHHGRPGPLFGLGVLGAFNRLTRPIVSPPPVMYYPPYCRPGDFNCNGVPDVVERRRRFGIFSSIDGVTAPIDADMDPIGCGCDGDVCHDNEDVQFMASQLGSFTRDIFSDESQTMEVGEDMDEVGEVGEETDEIGDCEDDGVCIGDCVDDANDDFNTYYDQALMGDDMENIGWSIFGKKKEEKRVVEEKPVVNNNINVQQESAGSRVLRTGLTILTMPARIVANGVKGAAGALSDGISSVTSGSQPVVNTTNPIGVSVDSTFEPFPLGNLLQGGDEALQVYINGNVDTLHELIIGDSSMVDLCQVSGIEIGDTLADSFEIGEQLETVQMDLIGLNMRAQPPKIQAPKQPIKVTPKPTNQQTKLQSKNYNTQKSPGSQTQQKGNTSKQSAGIGKSLKTDPNANKQNSSKQNMPKLVTKKPNGKPNPNANKKKEDPQPINKKTQDPQQTQQKIKPPKDKNIKEPTLSQTKVKQPKGQTNYEPAQQKSTYDVTQPKIKSNPSKSTMDYNQTQTNSQYQYNPGRLSGDNKAAMFSDGVNGIANLTHAASGALGHFLSYKGATEVSKDETERKRMDMEIEDKRLKSQNMELERQRLENDRVRMMSCNIDDSLDDLLI